MTLLGPICAFLSSFTWAVGSTVYSKVSQHHSTASVNFMRALIALPLFALGTFIAAGSFSGGIDTFQQVPLTNISWFALSMICSYGLGDSCFLLATQALGVPGALAIASSYPIWTVLAGIAFRGESIAPLQGAGVLVTIAGVVLVILMGQRTHAKSAVKNGVILAVLASLFWGVNSYSVAQGGTGVSPFAGNTFRMLCALVTTSLIFVSSTKTRPGHLHSSLLLPWSVLKPYLWIFVFEAFCGSLFFMYGLANSPLYLGSTLSALAPVLAVPIAVMTKTESLQLGKGVGVLLVVVGVWLMLV